MERTMDKPALRYEDCALLRCVSTGESDIVQVHDFTPRVQLVLDLFPGTRNYRRLILPWLSDDVGYGAEIYGRQFVSRGPKMRGRGGR